jgi:hypothetical protein
VPTRTLTRDLCDVCFAEDGRETEAPNRLRFGWQGRDYLLLLCDEHVDVRDQLQHLSEIATPESGRRRAAAPAVPRPVRSTVEHDQGSARRTAFSQLSDDEKERFRKWADLPTARRIADRRVEEWIAAGRP